MGAYERITAKSLLRDHKYVDGYFISRYGLNLYRGCAHDCVYCDGRSEKYQVNQDFAHEVALKQNAPALLDTELSRLEKRGALTPSFIMFGGGVGDFFQFADEPVTGELFTVIENHHLPLHILTKSANVLSYLSQICAIDHIRRALVSFSLSTSDDSLGEILEPGASLPSKRLDALSQLRGRGIHGGIYLMPVIPFITDSEKKIRSTVRDALNAGAEYIVFGGMTLKQGRQRDYFYSFLKQYFEKAIPWYDSIYQGDKWGGAVPAYYERLSKYALPIIEQSKAALMIPPQIFADVLDVNGRISVMCTQIDHILRAKGIYSPYGRAAHAISLCKTALEKPEDLRDIEGISENAKKVISDIISTGDSRTYRSLITPAL